MPMRRERACRRPQVPPHIRCAPSLQENASHDDVCNNNDNNNDDDDDDDHDDDDDDDHDDDLSLLVTFLYPFKPL